MIFTWLLLGFLLIGIAVSQDCPANKVITAASGNISTPLYPSNYPANLSCSWTIQAPAGKHIKLHVTDMQIEECGYDCTCDKLELAIGKTSSHRRSVICQNELSKPKDYSKPLYSVFNTLWLKFHSNNSPSNQYKGFFATYEQINYTPPDCPSDPIVYTENTGSITSPNYPNNYPSEKTCYWMISVSDGPRVKLNFKNFTLQDTGCRSSLEGKCTCDYVKVYDGENNSTLAELCGSKLPSPVISKSKKMLIKFFSNNLDDFKGFRAEYTSTNEEPPTGKATTTSSSNMAGLITVVMTSMILFENHH